LLLLILLLLWCLWLQVSAVLAVLLPREGLQAVPLYALGASSGGAFVLTLPAYLPLKGEPGQDNVCQIDMESPFQHFQSWLV
jgi:hypothetical protein